MLRGVDAKSCAYMRTYTWTRTKAPTSACVQNAYTHMRLDLCMKRLLLIVCSCTFENYVLCSTMKLQSGCLSMCEPIVTLCVCSLPLSLSLALVSVRILLQTRVSGRKHGDREPVHHADSGSDYRSCQRAETRLQTSSRGVGSFHISQFRSVV